MPSLAAMAAEELAQATRGAACVQLVTLDCDDLQLRLCGVSLDTTACGGRRVCLSRVHAFVCVRPSGLLIVRIRCCYLFVFFESGRQEVEDAMHNGSGCE